MLQFINYSTPLQSDQTRKMLLYNCIITGGEWLNRIEHASYQLFLLHHACTEHYFLLKCCLVDITSQATCSESDSLDSSRSKMKTSSCNMMLENAKQVSAKANRKISKQAKKVSKTNKEEVSKQEARKKKVSKQIINKKGKNKQVSK